MWKFFACSINQYYITLICTSSLADGSVKDITAKYASQWLSHTRKQRVESDWWRESLQPYASTNEELDDRENESIKGVHVFCVHFCRRLDFHSM